VNAADRKQRGNNWSRHALLLVHGNSARVLRLCAAAR
jgi:hypothetical protein